MTTPTPKGVVGGHFLAYPNRKHTRHPGPPLLTYSRTLRAPHRGHSSHQPGPDHIVIRINAHPVEPE